MFKKLLNTLFVINEPIGRLTYFKLGVSIIIFALLGVYIGSSFVGDWFFVLWGILILTMCFVLYTKRAWDIFGNRAIGIVVATLFIACILLSKMFPYLKIVKFILALVLLFTKGQITGKKQIEENKKENIEVSEEG